MEPERKSVPAHRCFSTQDLHDLNTPFIQNLPKDDQETQCSKCGKAIATLESDDGNLAVQLDTHLDSGRSAKKLILQSMLASIPAIPLAILACSSATGFLAGSAANAALGILVGSSIYIPSYIGYSLYFNREQLKKESGAWDFKLMRSRIAQGVKFLLTKESLEYIVKFTLHFELLSNTNLDGGVAYITASAITGVFGHLSVPYFSRLFGRRARQS